MREMGNPERMATRLRCALRQNEITGAELARRAGMNKSSITQYLQGKHAASREAAERMAVILRVSPAWLMGYDVPATEAEDDAAPGAPGLNKRRFIQVGRTTINVDHIVTITSEENGTVTVLLDTGGTVTGIMMD